MKQNLLNSLLLSLLFCLPLLAQDVSVSGRVTSSDDGSGLPGVSVQVKGTNRGTTTDASGTYRISAPANARLVFSFIGYTNQEVVVGNRTTVSVSLQTDATNLDEVLVVGYGVQQKREVTGAIANVTAKQLENIPLATLEQGLQGRAAGVQITQNSGTPGGGNTVRIRGASSITASNEPLYVIDGLPINTGNYSSIGVGNQQQNALTDLNPSDIESMEVLKDAAASAIYGSRAANGVIIITTKRGKSGATQVNLNVYRGEQTAWKLYNPLTGPQYSQLLSDMFQNRYPVNAAGAIVVGGTTYPTYGDLAAAVYGDGNNTNGFRDPGQFNNPSTTPVSTNWFKQVFRTAPVYQADLSIRGGNDKTKFFVSATQYKQQGTIIGSSFERFSIRVNLDHSINSRLRIGASIAPSRSVNTRIQNDNNINGVLSTAVLLAPDVPVYNADGSFGHDPTSSVENPLAAATQPTLTGIDFRLLASGYGEVDILKNLSFRSVWSLDFLGLRENQFIPTTTNTGKGTNGTGVANSAQDIGFLSENYFNYHTTIAGKHTIAATVGASWQQSNYDNIFARATNYPGNSIKQLSAGSVKSDASTTATSWGFESFYARLNYDYKGKYQVQVSGREDGSSRFGANQRFGFFPSVSGGWRIVEESFMKNQTIISDLKVRASWGKTGNSNFGNNFPALGLYSGGVQYVQSPALYPTQIPNPDLHWEKTTQTDVGIDIGLFGRFNITADYYNKQTDDLLLNRPIASSSGFTTVAQNVGKMENKGIELGLSSQNIRTSGFRWTTDFNIAFNRNKIVALADGVQPFGAGFASWVEAGQSIGSFRGYRVEKIFQTQEDINTLDAAAQAKYGTSARYQTANTKPGDIKFKDINGDGRVTSDDQEILGSAQPKFLGGFTNTFSFKGFDLMVLYQFQYGNKIFNDTKAFAEGMNSQFGPTDGVLRRWIPTNTNTDIPRAVYGDPNNNRRNSDRFIEDGSYGRIKNVVLGYTLPKTLVNRIKLRTLRVYAQAQNLLTFTKYSGLDPEVSTFSGSNTAIGTDFLTYPQPRTITFGINVGL